MNNLIKLILFSVLIFAISCSTEKSSKVDKVNPFIGTGGHGHTYPGASSPFGMVQLSPDTRLDGWDGCSAYHYSDSVVYGFSHTHLSGTGVSDYADVLLMPTTGDLKLNKLDFASFFSHKNEIASPGYYATKLNDYNILVELTATPRVGFHKYIFPKSENAHIVIDLKHRDMVLDASIAIVGDREIEGKRISKAWAEEQHVYFVAQFSKPFKAYGIAINDKIVQDISRAEGKNIKSYVSFTTKDNEEILVKVGISAVSIQNARKNLEAEIPQWDFKQVKEQVRQSWKKELGKINIRGGTAEQQIVFYTALYHSMLAPNIYNDVDGKYRGRDLKIHQTEGFDYYTVFSLWDTYRATHPLYTIIDRKRTNDFIQTFIKQYEQGGMLPVWELSANETGCMIGYHSVPVITDAYMKGIRDYDVEKAFEAMLNSAKQDHLGLEYYKKKGYIPADKEAESVSKTLEYAYDDWCIAQMAKDLNKEAEYESFIQRAQNYKNLYDPSTAFMRAKYNDSWDIPFDPREVNFNFTEANSWQYSFYVPQDITGLIKLHGGKEQLETKLDGLFTENSETTGRQQSDITGLIGQYAHGNEPSHHMAYLYNYLNKPWKTQKMISQILEEMYSNQPDGLSGNEDCGQMSSWYVLSAMGFYPVTPASNIYAIGTPLFSEAKINLENGKQFVIKANHVNEENIYIQSAKLNGETYTKSYLSHTTLMDGGELEFEMGSQPNKNWGVAEVDIPVSSIQDSPIMPVPFIEAKKTFIGSQMVSLGSIIDGVEIHYTLDGTEPNMQSPVFTQAFSINKTTVIKAFAHNKELGSSDHIDAQFFAVPKGRSVQYFINGVPINNDSEKRPYSPQYTAGGDMGLIDLIKGSADFKTGEWQGFEGIDMEVVVDLGKKQRIKYLSTGCQQDSKSWILMPVEVKYFTSNDGVFFKPLATVKNDVDPRKQGGIIKNFEVNVNTRTRYIKVIAKNMGKLPNWHLGYELDGKVWIFIDEIEIK